MEAKIQKLKSYLKEPERAIKGNDSLLVRLQDILHVREQHAPTEARHDRDIYELFHATMSLFLQPIGGHNAWFSIGKQEPLFYAEVNGDGSYTDPEDWDRENRFLLENRDNDDIFSVRTEHRYSKWEHEIHRLHFPSDILKDENIVFFDGFTGNDLIPKKSWELWKSFQSILLWKGKNQETIKFQRRKRIEKTTLQEICDSFCMIPMPYKDKVEYESYISGIEEAPSENNIQTSPVLFSEYLLSEIHRLCNGKQFENITSDEFKNAVNDPARHGCKLAIRKKEIARAYHIIRNLKEKVEGEGQGVIWLTNILAALGVQESNYKSKYTVVGDDDSNPRNLDFREALEPIFT